MTPKVRVPWTVADTGDLRAAAECGHSVKEIADYMGRDQEDILGKMHELGIVPVNMLEFRGR
jgi:hypothetical protein